MNSMYSENTARLNVYRYDIRDIINKIILICSTKDIHSRNNSVCNNINTFELQNWSNQIINAPLNELNVIVDKIHKILNKFNILFNFHSEFIVNGSLEEKLHMIWDQLIEIIKLLNINKNTNYTNEENQFVDLTVANKLSKYLKTVKPQAMGNRKRGTRNKRKRRSSRIR